MSHTLFKKLSQYEPPTCDDGRSPLDVMDSFITSNQKEARAVGDACRSIEWIPKELQELVDLH
jgi:hypothetical protein